MIGPRPFLQAWHFCLVGPGWILPVRQTSRQCIFAVMANEECDSEFENVLMTPLETLRLLNLDEAQMQQMQMPPPPFPHNSIGHKSEWTEST